MDSQHLLLRFLETLDAALAGGESLGQALARLRIIASADDPLDAALAWPQHYRDLLQRPKRRRRLSSDAPETTPVPSAPEDGAAAFYRVRLADQPDGYVSKHPHDARCAWMYSTKDFLKRNPGTRFSDKVSKQIQCLSFAKVPLYFVTDHYQSIEEEFLTKVEDDQIWLPSEASFPHPEKTELALAGALALFDEESTVKVHQARRVQDVLLSLCTAGDQCQKRAGAWLERILALFSVRHSIEWLVDDVFPPERMQCHLCGLDRSISMRLEIRRYGTLLGEYFLGSHCGERLVLAKAMAESMRGESDVQHYMDSITALLASSEPSTP